MKSLFLLFLLSLNFLNLTQAETVYFTRMFSAVALKGYDTVAYHQQNEAIKGNPKLSYEWRGAKWYFSSEDNLQAFKIEPEKFAPQFGGWCAYAMASGQKVGVDPKAFDIIDGKLYLNYNTKVQKKWRKKQDSNILKAANFWKKIQE